MINLHCPYDRPMKYNKQFPLNKFREYLSKSIQA